MAAGGNKEENGEVLEEQQRVGGELHGVVG